MEMQVQKKFGSLKCPACGKEDIQVADHFKYRDFDGSLFNMEADFGLCRNCGFVRVMVPFDDAQISDHYTHHSLYNSLSGVGVGGSTTEDIVRYKHYLSILAGLENKSGAIADIGCSSGGFLKYLRREAGYEKKLTGIDLDTRALASLKDEGIDAVQGSALSLNLSNDSLDLAFYNHILEHILDIDSVLSEMVRVMMDGGHALIEVPDATAYSESRVHDFYWAGMKEHVNHFTPMALCNLLSRRGIEIVRVARNKFPMKGGVHYPSLIVVARIIKNGKAHHPRFGTERGDVHWLSAYMNQERKFAARTRSNLKTFLEGRSILICWRWMCCRSPRIQPCWIPTRQSKFKLFPIAAFRLRIKRCSGSRLFARLR
jgi:SAM-dependent methyltransferase